MNAARIRNSLPIFFISTFFSRQHCVIDSKINAKFKNRFSPEINNHNFKPRYRLPFKSSENF